MPSSLIRGLLTALLTLISLTAMSQVHIYHGAYTYSSEILYTWDGKHLYRGSYAYSSEILYTWDGKHLYRGPYAYSSEILFTLDGAVPVPVLVVGLQL